MGMRNPVGNRSLAAVTAAAGIIILSVTGSPAIAATAPRGQPALTASAASAAPAHPVPVAHAPERKPSGKGQPPCPLGPNFTGFTTSATNVPSGAAVTLTATWDCDIGPTPYWVQIYDTVTGELVGNCGAGTTCTATVTEPGSSTHNYEAFIDEGGSTPPTPDGDNNSVNAYVTWQSPGDHISVSLSGPSAIGWDSGPGIYTAYANHHFPFYIEIFDEATSTLLAACFPGNSCTVSFTPGQGSLTDLVAFVSRHRSTALPPVGTMASSNVLVTTQEERPPPTSW
jgi:hypothetical protein